MPQPFERDLAGNIGKMNPTDMNYINHSGKWESQLYISEQK